MQVCRSFLSIHGRSAILLSTFLGAGIVAGPSSDSRGQSAVAFNVPPAGTVATYQCNGGEASTVKYAIESVDGDTLTVKVTGDGKDFGTYRRKAWQMVGTTLYEELNYKGGGNFTKMAGRSPRAGAILRRWLG